MMSKQMATCEYGPAFEIEKIRADFPILSRRVNGKPLVYLDSAASAQKPTCTYTYAIVTRRRRSLRQSSATSMRTVYLDRQLESTISTPPTVSSPL